MLFKSYGQQILLEILILNDVEKYLKHTIQGWFGTVNSFPEIGYL